jgi:ankyrin repeat protein
MEIIPLDVYKRFTDQVGRLVLNAASAGNLCEVARLIAMGGDPNYRDPRSGSTPLKAAAQSGYFEIVKYLIEMAHVFPCQYVACAAQNNGHKRIAEFLWNYTSPLVPGSSYYCVTGGFPK